MEKVNVEVYNLEVTVTTVSVIKTQNYIVHGRRNLKRDDGDDPK